MARYTRPSYNANLVFAAACAAHRVNEGYIKQDVVTIHEDGSYTVDKVANKVLIRSFLNGDFDITDSDREMAEKVLTFCRGVSFKIITGKALTDFELAMLRIADLEVIESSYDIAVISSLPASYERSIVRHEQTVRLRESSGCLSDEVGTKVELDIEVVRCNFSNTWETYFVTAITEGGVVFFSYKKKVELGSKLRVKGKVKAHKEDRTQLSHVKFL